MGSLAPALCLPALRFQFHLHSHLSEVKCGLSPTNTYSLSPAIPPDPLSDFTDLYLFSCLIHPRPVRVPINNIIIKEGLEIYDTQVKSGPLLVL